MQYAKDNPFGERRADYRSAQIVQALYNINRDVKKKPDPWAIEQFLLKFSSSDLPPAPKRTQTWQQQKAIVKAIVAAYAAPKRPVRPKKEPKPLQLPKPRPKRKKT